MPDDNSLAKQLELTITTQLIRAGENSASDGDPGEMLSDSDYTSIARKAIADLGIGARVKLHADVWATEIKKLTRRYAEAAVQEKVKRVARRGLPT